MAIVKLDKVRNLKRYDEYVLKDRECEIHETGPEGLGGQMESAIKDEHARLNNKRMKHLAFTVTQSWHPKESDLFPVEKYNQMGRELGERFAPGHLVWVTTHTDKSHIHNHITICSVHSETGKALARQRDDFKRLHEINNDIARTNGLALNLPRVKDQAVKLADGAHKMVAAGKMPWVMDLSQKAGFSRMLSTNFDEFVGQMKTLGVDVRVENKNIVYEYGGNGKKRGNKLGKDFDKDGLMKAFKENDEKFAKLPGLREQIRSDYGSAFGGKGNPLGTPGNLSSESTHHRGDGQKDYGKFTKIPRHHTGRELPAIFDERGGVLYQEMKNAQKMSIFEYCAKHKIQTTNNEKGETVLRGKEFVVLKNSEWTNTKNRTTGTVIDFAAIHGETTFLRAVAKINNNPRLLLLEQVMGEYKKGYQSFYIPKPKAAAPEKALKTLNRFLNSRGIRDDMAQSFHHDKNVHVGADLSVWLMGQKGDSALEFREEKSGQWKQKRHGNPAGVFFESVAKSKNAVIYKDPFDFLHAKAKGLLPHQREASLLVMMGDGGSERRIDEFFALHTHITQAHLAQSAKAGRDEQGQKMYHDLKRRFDPFNIEIKELRLGAIDKERGRGPDISF